MLIDTETDPGFDGPSIEFLVPWSMLLNEEASYIIPVVTVV